MDSRPTDQLTQPCSSRGSDLQPNDGSTAAEQTSPSSPSPSTAKISETRIPASPNLVVSRQVRLLQFIHSIQKGTLRYYLAKFAFRTPTQSTQSGISSGRKLLSDLYGEGGNKKRGLPGPKTKIQASGVPLLFSGPAPRRPLWR